MSRDISTNYRFQVRPETGEPDSPFVIQDRSTGRLVCTEGSGDPLRFFTAGEAHQWCETHGERGWRR
jgi:hypothetical protein